MGTLAAEGSDLVLYVLASILLGDLLLLLIAYLVIKAAVLSALRQHAREERRRATGNLPPKTTPGVKSLTMPEDQRKD